MADFEWHVIEPLLPNKPRGVPRVDDHRVLNGIFWVLRSGAPWRERCDNDGITPPLPSRSLNAHSAFLTRR
ncbi:transposase [Agrobacterium larrymoorei]|uniref:Transposase n=1 Tax=Agrobacterium larrymoorei TaxID=160699 RepID=A0AAJ2EPI5_9HYPH|nr:transposase [Agrobacterium larrymoorei]